MIRVKPLSTCVPSARGQGHLSGFACPESAANRSLRALFRAHSGVFPEQQPTLRLVSPPYPLCPVASTLAIRGTRVLLST